MALLGVTTSGSVAVMASRLVLTGAGAAAAMTAAYIILRWRRDLALLSYAARLLAAARTSPRLRPWLYPWSIMSRRFHIFLSTAFGVLMVLLSLQLLANLGQVLLSRWGEGAAYTPPAAPVLQRGARGSVPNVPLTFFGLALFWGTGFYLMCRRDRIARFSEEVFEAATALRRGEAVVLQPRATAPSRRLVRLVSAIGLLDLVLGAVWVWALTRWG